MSDPKTAIKATLDQYRNNLISSNAEGCAALYTTDGVTMAQHFPSQVGIDAITKWYTLCFQNLSLDVEFKIHEIVVASDEYAFARTSSAGTQKQLTSGKTSQESNQELFVMQKVGGEWKVARYCFCTVNPPQA